MEIKEYYPIKVDHWMHQPIEKFMGLNNDNGYVLTLGISPEDPNDLTCCFFNIWIEKRIVNETTGEVVFYAKTYSAFKVKNEFKKPTSEFFFDLVCKSTRDFAAIFYQATKGTNLDGRRIRKPQFSDYKADLQKTIDVWAKKYQNSFLLKRPNWQNSFRDLPRIPRYKEWSSGSYSTVEQDISHKLLDGQALTGEEAEAFSLLSNFYSDLDKKLRTVDYKTFTSDDIENFKNYIFYAFNYAAVMSNKLNVIQTYRLVVNESVAAEDKSLTHADYVKYPQLDLVRKLNRYNRANTPNTNIFYSTETIDTALKELRPPVNKLVSIGIWKTKNPEKALVSFPISHSDEAIAASYSVKDATHAFENNKNYGPDILKNFMRYYFRMLGREFTKKVGFHLEYMISALFSETILSLKENELNDDFKFECIIYPSVGNDFGSHNLAILPSTLDSDFYLSKVIEFRVEEAYYDNKHIPVDPNAITLAKVTNLRVCREIGKDGTLRW